jgi:hypothetical protein
MKTPRARPKGSWMCHIEMKENGVRIETCLTGTGVINGGNYENNTVLSDSIKLETILNHLSKLSDYWEELYSKSFIIVCLIFLLCDKG